MSWKKGTRGGKCQGGWAVPAQQRHSGDGGCSTCVPHLHSTSGDLQGPQCWWLWGPRHWGQWVAVPRASQRGRRPPAPPRAQSIPCGADVLARLIQICPNFPFFLTGRKLPQQGLLKQEHSWHRRTLGTRGSTGSGGAGAAKSPQLLHPAPRARGAPRRGWG